MSQLCFGESQTGHLTCNFVVSFFLFLFWVSLFYRRPRLADMLPTASKGAALSGFKGRPFPVLVFHTGSFTLRDETSASMCVCSPTGMKESSQRTEASFQA